ncbi:MAG: tetratricopeptide repeat protein [Candidatus Marinimicrobia bacterium]|nr:tetratricopeptide repeat protein [Candidatus Neomarinimicrobiota bacterium]
MNKRIIISIAVMIFVLLAVIAAGIRKSPDVTTLSQEAYELYLRGVDNNQNFYHKDAIELLEKAVELDNEFAMAYLELHHSYLAEGNYLKSRQMVEKAALFKEYVSEREGLIIEIHRNMGGEYDQPVADSLIEILYQKYPDTIEPHLFKARSAVREGDFEASIIEYELVRKINKDYAPVYNILGYMYAELRRYDEAIENLKEYAKKAPGKANPFDSLGEILIRVGRYEEAISNLNRALEIKPELNETNNFLGSAIHKNLGNAYLGRGQVTKAVHHYKRAQDLNPGENILIEAVTNRYMALLLTDRHDEFNSYTEGLNILASKEMTKPIKHLIKGIYYTLTKDIDSALDESAEMNELIIELAAENPNARERLVSIQGMLEAEVMLSLGKYSEAVDIYLTKCFNIDMANHSVWLNWRFAEAYRLNEDYENSEKIVENVLGINPNNFILRSVLVQALFDRGEYKKAKAELKKFNELIRDADDDIRIIAKMNKIAEALEVLL